MVKEVPQLPKYQCELCDQTYSKSERAYKCEAKGLPEFRYKSGDKLETVIKITIPAQIGHFGLYEVGTFANVTILDRNHLRHTPCYVIEHPQTQGQYWRYPELGFELSDDMKPLKEPDEIIRFGEIDFEFSINQTSSQALWREFRKFLREHGLSRLYLPQVIAEPINPR